MGDPQDEEGKETQRLPEDLDVEIQEDRTEHDTLQVVWLHDTEEEHQATTATNIDTSTHTSDSKRGTAHKHSRTIVTITATT